VTACPYCQEPLAGLGTFCWRCERYTDEATEPTAPLPDIRTEDERKRDARAPVELLGWHVVDTEQGWRPFECPKCGGPIPGGTRVERGFPDWLVIGHGRTAFLEWKSENGRQSPAQRAFQDRCKVAGIPYRVVKTTEQAVAFLEEVKR
jgi:hypothetical protein